MNTTIARIKVIAQASVTWLLVAMTVVQIVADEIVSVLPAGVAENVGAVTLRVVAVLAAAVAIIRRVSEVTPADRGLLPPA